MLKNVHKGSASSVKSFPNASLIAVPVLVFKGLLTLQSINRSKIKGNNDDRNRIGRSTLRFLQSPHCAVTCLEYAHSCGPGANICNTSNAYHMQHAVGHLVTKGQFQFSVSVSAQDGIVALGKAHTRSAPSLSSLPKVALETVPIFVWLNTDRFRPWRVECRPLPFSTPLSFRRSML